MMDQNPVPIRTTTTLLIAISLFVLILITLEKTGVPRGYSITFTALTLFFLWLLPSLGGGTTKPSKYLFVNHQVRSGINALTLACGVTLPIIVVFSTNIYFTHPKFLLALSVALISGLTLSAIFFSRQIRTSAQPDICSILVDRFQISIPAKFVAIIIALAMLGLLVSSLQGGAMILGWFFDLSPAIALILFALAVLMASMIGGLSSITTLSTIAIIIFIVSLNLPLLIHSVQTTSFPIGHLSFGYGAFEPIVQLEEQLGSISYPVISSAISQSSKLFEMHSGQGVILAILLALGVAVLPYSLQQYTTSSEPERASDAAMKSIIIVGFVLTSIFALSAYTKLGIYETIIGLTIAEAGVEAPFLYNWGGRELEFVRLCGEVINTKKDLINACGDSAEFSINVSDLKIHGDLLFAASPEVSGFPFAFTALLVVAMILVLCALSAMALFSAANNLVSSFYATLPGKVGSGKIFFARLISICLILIAVVILLFNQINIVSLTLISLGLLASTLFPALIALFHWKQITPTLLTISVGAGFIVTCLCMVFASAGIDFVAGNGDELQLRLPFITGNMPTELSGFYGLIASTIVLLISAVIKRLMHLRQEAEA